MAKKILVLPGDGIGPEIIAEAMKVLEHLRKTGGLALEIEHGLIGGASYEAHGEPLTAATLAKAKAADAVLLGAVGGQQWEPLPIALRPE
ncbi:MAG: isocitrate/isopropylmalate family dehydrogenase, partial [Gammaproteobacteria bacterium]